MSREGRASLKPAYEPPLGLRAEGKAPRCGDWLSTSLSSSTLGEGKPQVINNQA